MFDLVQSYKLVKRLSAFYEKQNQALVGKYEYVLAQLVYLQVLLNRQAGSVSEKLTASKQRFLQTATMRKLLSRIYRRRGAVVNTVMVFVIISQVLDIVWDLVKKGCYAASGDIVRGPPLLFNV